MKAIIPWFEPRYSHCQTWKECAFKYISRDRGVKFAPKPKLVALEEFGELENRPGLCATAEGGKPHKFVRAKTEVLDQKKLKKDPIYTSKHGIKIDLSTVVKNIRRTLKLKKDLPAMFPEAQVVSLPHVVIVLIRYNNEGCCELNTSVLVKYKDSEGLKADHEDGYATYELPKVEFLGNDHIFIVCCGCNCGGYDEEWAVSYLSRTEGFRPLFGDEGEYDFPIICYDGMIQYFRKQKFYAQSCTIEEGWIPTPYASSKSPVFVKSQRRIHKDDALDSKYLVLKGDDNRLLVYDVVRGMMVPIKKDGNKHVLDDRIVKG